jgi:hypothetical protein
MVRYRVKPERVDENEALVRGVYEELARTKPDGLRYATFQLDDGATFLHVAYHEGDGSPLTGLPAFARFQEGITDRCDEQPLVSELRRIGSYGL